MDIKISNEIDGNPREEMSRIFTEGFKQWLKFFSKNSETLTKAFAHAFVLERFYVAVIDGEIAGMTACTNGKTSSIKLDKRELTKYLGFVKGTIASKVLVQYFEKAPYPFELEEIMGSIEFVATSSKFFKQGVASNIIKTIITNTHYQSYV